MPDFYAKIYYHDGSINKVDISTKKAVKSSVEKAQKKIPNIFRNLNIHVTSDFSNLPKTGSELNKYLKENEKRFRATKGITTDDTERKEIFIQESAFIFDKVSNIFSFPPSFSAKKEIEQATMHELGHLYDYSGGDKNLHSEHQKLINKYYGKTDSEIKLLPREEKFLEEYRKNNGYSDKKEFKEALKKDLQSLNLDFRIRNNYGYLIGEFYNSGLDVIPNIKDIEAADASRMEIFAQLFSYAMGTDDGNKDDFIKLFLNTYNIVNKYIKTATDINYHLI